MSNYDDYSATGRTQAVEYDAGLRAHMLKVYNYMTGGVALTGVIAMLLGNYFLGNMEAAREFYGSGLYLVAAFSPLAFVLVLSFGINRMSSSTAQMVFWTFAAVMGVSLSTIMLRYTGESIARIFFITAIMFASLSAWGYTTKRNLKAMGTFMFMGLIGLVVASIANIFLQSSAMSFGISVIGVLVFAGLTAWDNQRIKQNYFAIGHDTELLAKSAIMGALSLYLNFINMFLFLLRLFGGGRN